MKAEDPVAWVVFAENGNVRLWGKDRASPQAFADENGLKCEPVYRAAPPSGSTVAPQDAGAALRTIAAFATSEEMQSTINIECAHNAFAAGWHAGAPLADFRSGYDECVTIARVALALPRAERGA